VCLLLVCLQPEGWCTEQVFYYMMFVTAIGLTPGGSGTVHIYTQTLHRTTQ